MYSVEEKEAFRTYMENKLVDMDADKAELEHIFLSIYANPVVSDRGLK